MEIKKTQRGFDIVEFNDEYGESCTLQKSSLADKDCIWLGIYNPKAKILASKIIKNGTGWADYPLPDDVEIHSRMHLNREQVQSLLPFLQKFVMTGDIGE